jgi:Siphovirus Gp157
MNPQFIVNVRQQIAAIRAECAEHDDIQLLADMLEGSTDIERLVSAFVLEIETAQATADGLGFQASKLFGRAKAATERAEKLRRLLVGLLTEAGVKKVGRAYVGYPQPSVAITDEKDIPPEFMRTRITEAPDKSAIKAALESGQIVPGATLSNPEPFVRIN